MSDTLIVATHNTHKTGEIAAMLEGFGFETILDLTAFPDLVAPEEDGDTFDANAAIKAIAASGAMPEALVLADDSGIEVDALDGRPGVRSARFAGEDATDADNRARLLTELAEAGARGKERSARFRCALAVARDGEVIASFDGAVEGVVINEEKGEGGFGYDSLFVPEGHCETFAQLPAEVKQTLSHRARAVEQLKAWLRKTR